MKKKRKVGTPRAKRQSARCSTSLPSITINLPPGLDFLSQAQAEEVLELIATPQEEERIIILRHHVPRPSDPTDTAARAIIINTKTKETRCCIQRKGKKIWLDTPTHPEAKKSNSTKLPAPAKRN